MRSVRRTVDEISEATCVKWELAISDQETDKKISRIQNKKLYCRSETITWRT